LEKNQIGAWSRDYEIVGGTYYGFEAFGLGKGFSNQRANCYVEIFFHDQNRQLVIDQRTGNFSRPFYPWGEEQENGWIKFKGVVRVPKEAKLATIRLFLRWEPRARIEWSNIQFRQCTEPKPRKVRIGALNFRPTGGKSAMDNCRMFEPFVKQARDKKGRLTGSW
jgi:hypothetical protein